MAAVRELLRVRDDAAVERLDGGRLALSEGHMRMPVGPLGPGLAGAVEALLDGGAPERELVQGAMAAEGADAVMRLQILLRRLMTAGWLERAVVEGDAPLATLRPFGHVLPPVPGRLDPERPVVLSRFAALRAVEGELRAESPRTTFSVALHDPSLAAVIAALTVPATPPQGEAAAAVLALLVHARVVVPAGEEEAGPLDQWSFPDLLFHTRSRLGGHLGGYGGTYHRRDRAEPLPAVKPPPEVTVALPRADLEAAVAADPPYGEVMEARHSVREHDDEHPITVAQLGELLDRCARVRAVFHDGEQELSRRPYPGGGAVYELELYPLVSNCAGVEPGLYHYDAGGHALGRVAEPGPAVRLLAEYSRRTAVMERDPQVVLLIAARFGRAMWKYESMAYALILKNVGVMYQTLYGAATAMGLAPCALGGGNPDGFAAATGLDPYAETTVGEFVLGSRRRDDA